MTDEQRHYYDALVRRVKTLNDTLQQENVQPVPVGVVQFMASLVLRTAAAYCGGALRDHLWSWVSGHQREDAGFCAFCGRPKTQERPMCDECWKQASADDREAEEALLIELVGEDPDDEGENDAPR
jgi:hypothetical protein